MRVPAEEVAVGDSLRDSDGEWRKVHRVATFEPYRSVQIQAQGLNIASTRGEEFEVRRENG